MMTYNVGDDVTDGKSTGTIIAINGERLLVRWTSPSEYDGTSWISSDAVSPVHNCENCRHNALADNEEPCLSCGDGDDNNWKPKEFTERAAHYKRLSPETIQRAQDVLTPEQFQGAMLYTMMRYIERFGHKDDPLKEALKISDYAGYLVKSLEGRRVTDD